VNGHRKVLEEVRPPNVAAQSRNGYCRTSQSKNLGTVRGAASYRKNGQNEEQIKFPLESHCLTNNLSQEAPKRLIGRIKKMISICLALACPGFH